MIRNEFMTRLSAELRRNHVADAADIEEEYEQHFAFKLADGYSEEEIAAKLGALFFLLLAAWGLVMAAAAVAFAGTAVCLLAGWGMNGLLPPAPHWCGAVAALALLALAVLAAASRTPLRRAPGAPRCRSCPPRHSFSRRPRAAMTALLIFAVCFVLTYIVCAVSAGNVQFWHTWGWFGKLAI